MPTIADFPPAMSFLFEPARFKVGCGGRDSAKSWSFARALLIQSLDTQDRILCARQYQSSIKDSVHHLFESQIRALDLGMHYTVQKTEILGRGNTGALFGFLGLAHNAEEVKSWEGAKKCWVEEAQNVNKSSWDYLIPTIRLPGSEIWVSFNPLLESDDTYQRFVVDPEPGTVLRRVTWRDNPWASEVLAPGRDKMRDAKPDDYEWMWEGQCRRMLEGAIYAEELRAAEKEGRITQVPYDPKYPVDTYWDLGWADYTSIWFVQSAPMVFRVIDFHQDHLKKMPDYITALQAKKYVYRTQYLPHDAANENLTGATPQELLQAAGYVVKVVPRVPNKRQGIDAGRLAFPKCYFDAKKCADGLQALRHYRFERDEESGHLSKLPVHDEHSHAADAWQTLGLAIQGPTVARGQHINYPNLGINVPRRGVHNSAHVFPRGVPSARR